MSARTDVLLWAQRVIARKAATADQILEIAAGAGLAAAQEAFHKIARIAHPDLHRSGLTPDELELVTTAYARAAAAYQEIRSQTLGSGRMRPIQGQGQGPGQGPGKGLGSNPALVPPAVTTGSPSPDMTPSPAGDPPINPAHAMTSKALLYYRKAELGLRRGDLTGAVLQLKMAIASDPQSQFLRSALAEVESEVGKKP
jgi:hypothetical protein